MERYLSCFLKSIIMPAEKMVDARKRTRFVRIQLISSEVFTGFMMARKADDENIIDISLFS